MNSSELHPYHLYRSTPQSDHIACLVNIQLGWEHERQRRASIGQTWPEFSEELVRRINDIPYISISRASPMRNDIEIIVPTTSQYSESLMDLFNFLSTIEGILKPETKYSVKELVALGHAEASEKQEQITDINAKAAARSLKTRRAFLAIANQMLPAELAQYHRMERTQEYPQHDVITTLELPELDSVQPAPIYMTWFYNLAVQQDGYPVVRPDPVDQNGHIGARICEFKARHSAPPYSDEPDRTYHTYYGWPEIVYRAYKIGNTYEAAKAEMQQAEQKDKDIFNNWDQIAVWFQEIKDYLSDNPTLAVPAKAHLLQTAAQLWTAYHIDESRD